MTVQNKNKILVIAAIATLFMSYRFAISKTLELRNRYRQLQEQELLFQNGPKQFSLLKKKEQYYDSIRNRYQLAGSSMQNNLLKTINGYVEDLDLQLIRFSEPHIEQQQGVTVKTYELVIQGNYNVSMQLIYKLEQKTRFGEIIHLQMLKQKNFRTGKDYLQTTFLLQSYQ